MSEKSTFKKWVKINEGHLITGFFGLVVVMIFFVLLKVADPKFLIP